MEMIDYKHSFALLGVAISPSRVNHLHASQIRPLGKGEWMGFESCFWLEI